MILAVVLAPMIVEHAGHDGGQERDGGDGDEQVHMQFSFRVKPAAGLTLLPFQAELAAGDIDRDVVEILGQLEV